MTPAEITGIINTADTLFKESRKAYIINDWPQYFLRISDAHSALLYLKLHLAGEEVQVHHAVQQLIDVLLEHRDTAIKLIEATVPKGEA